MRKLVFYFLVFLFASVCKGQSFDQVDSIVGEYPKIFKSEKKLSNRIKEDFKEPVNRARAIYTWIALNVSYGNKGKTAISYTYKNQSEKKAKELKLRNELSKSTLKNGIAVCEGYASLFWKICKLTEIESVVIDGYSKASLDNLGKPPALDHAWNAIRINGKWYLIDVTWASGYMDANRGVFLHHFTDSYFMTSPDLFLLNHFPKDKRWLLANKSFPDFSNQPFFYRAYLKLNAKIEVPQNGVIQVRTGEQIKFNLSSKKSLNLKYAFHSDDQTTKIEYQQENEQISFSIPISITKTDYLTIYNNSNGIVSYKIEIK